MRVACVLVTRLRAKVEMYRYSHLRDMPVVIVDRGNSGTRPLVVDRFPTLKERVNRPGICPLEHGTY